MQRKMKNSFKTGVLLLFIGLTTGLVSCSTVDDGSYIDPISLYEKIGGKWVLNSITQIDETNNKNLTLTDKLDFDTFVILLNVDENHQPTTFSVEGKAPALLPITGTWMLDHPFTKSDGSATQILLLSKDAKAALTVTVLPGANNIMEYKLTRKVKGLPYTSYTYNLMSAVAF